MAGLPSILAVYVLIFFRVAGLMIGAPVFGSANIPKRVKLLLAITLAWGLSVDVVLPVLPSSPWMLAMGIAGELIFGWAIGMALSLTFIAVTWAGEIIGQQMGINLGETFDPTFGKSSTLIGDMYFMLTLMIFLSCGGHRQMVLGIRASLHYLPLLSVGMTPSVLKLLEDLLKAATMLAVQIAAPMLLTMLVLDLALGFIGKTVPQMNVMSTGTSLKSAVGIGVLLATLVVTSHTVEAALVKSMYSVRDAWLGQLGAAS
jgi:flagellar biosynthetic protein FliR